MDNKDKLLSSVAAYYSDKLATHGETPFGVDWNGIAGQYLRFEQLSKIFNNANVFFSVNDIGCGYGAYYEFLKERYGKVRYSGFDISESMIKAASERYKNSLDTCFTVSSTPRVIADYGVASGIFNVRLDVPDIAWKSYIERTIILLNETSRVGFSFNCLTAYSEKVKMRRELYYANPCELFDFCKQNCSKNVALLHDYDLYEFTILVRK